jgi:hypothetical protein
MANWGQAFSNLGGGLGDISTLVKHLEFMKAQQEEETKRQLVVQAQAAANERNKEIFLDPSKGAPVQSRLEANLLKDLASADNLSKLPSETELTARARATGMDTSPFLGVSWRSDPNGMRPEINDLLAARNAAEKRLTTEANAPDTSIQETNPDGSQVTKFVSKRAGGTYNTGLSTTQSTLNKANADLAAAPTKVKSDNLVEAGTRGEKVKTAGATAFSQAAGQGAGHAPYEKPDVMFDDKTGAAVGEKWNPKTQSYDAKPIGDVSKTSPKEQGKLTSAQIDNVTRMNTAEVEGVKVLSMLKKSGLDQSNDPMDPRWQKFVAGTLKISSADYLKSDVQQRTAFIQAALVKSLMGGRPSEFTAKLYLQHLPAGEMTGSKLTQVLTNGLQQTGEARKEMEYLTGHDLAPRGGMTYQQWLTTAGGPATDPGTAAIDKAKRRGVLQ